ncbi:MAG: hypothetical protein M3O32_21305, partial [Actinomycetota bacterium]|nr:hypothetical protein [Actinomycetota bacterium]
MRRSGAEPMRVLLLGDRSVLGEADALREQRLPEQLADHVARRSGRGLDLDVLTDLSPAIGAVRGTFQRWRLWRYDAVVLVVDTAAVGARKARDLVALLDEVTGDANTSAGVVVSVVRRARTGAGRHRSDGRRGQWDRPDTVSEAVVWQPVEITPGRHESVPLVDVRRIAEELTVALHTLVPAGLLAEVPADPEVQRLSALVETGALDRPQDAKLDYIVRLAQEAFEVQSAELNFLDADRNWHIAVAGAERGSHPRATSLCNI